MKPTIEHPKVFISYAWGSQEYQNIVLSLASDLQSDGVEVLLDKWNLKEGHDTYAYMEQSVNDPTVTNVLILLDPVYAEKADGRSGGVGTETQIISPEIYNNVTQEKFLPVVMERTKNGDIPKPQYLKGILHFDLSVDDKYNDEYQRLVKRLFGVEIYTKPELGNIPKWVTEESSISTGKRMVLQSLKKNTNPKIARNDFLELLNELKENIVSFNSETDDYLKLYEEMLPMREEYLQIIKTSFAIENSSALIADFLQELYDDVESNTIVLKDMKKSFLHEIFIYTISMFYKMKDFESMAYFLNKSFFGKYYGNNNQKTGYSIFYHYSQPFAAAKNKADGKKYFCGIAQQWIDHIASAYCNKREFAFADVLLSNYSLFGANYGDRSPWFALTYVYDGEFDTIIQKIALQMKSKEIAQRWAKVFGFEDYISFRNKIKSELSKPDNQKTQRLRYNMSFSDVQLITDFIKPEEIGTIN